MGSIDKIVGKVDLGEPDHKPTVGKWNLPFAIELKEDFHIHWQDMRIEMDAEDFEEFFISMKKAYEAWKKDGKPKTLPKCKWYGRWLGEENMHFYKDRLKRTNAKGKTCHHFRYFPRTQSGKRYYDGVFIAEKQRGDGRYHFHYKNFRWELGRWQAKKVAQEMVKVLNEEKNT
jgi:hypothetical protein